MRRILLVFGIGFIVLSAMAANGGLAFANGAPIRVVLSYLDGVSNTGPKSASGIAEVVMAEGQVNLNVAGLPRLNGESYTVW
ncbi:MAG: hypothetical protein HY677_04120, partial [Chloroflexi bacterium]|nr:hypothetical protein [Chloroflexota bacterium]